MDINLALERFETYMLLKFSARSGKHPNDVLNVANGKEYEIAQLEAHFRSEITEWLEQPSDMDEMVDVANLAFLLWWAHYDRLTNGT